MILTMDLLKNYFKPEFLNRIDETIVFKPLEKDIQLKIIDKLLFELDQKLLKEYITISYSNNLKEYILNQAFDISYGARPLRRAIQRYLEDDISEKILRSELKDGKNVIVDLENDEL